MTTEATPGALGSNDQLGAVSEAQCWCKSCRPITFFDMRMVLCPTCGDKRCIHAVSHEAPCAKADIYAHNAWVERLILRAQQAPVNSATDERELYEQVCEQYDVAAAEVSRLMSDVATLRSTLALKEKAATWDRESLVCEERERWATAARLCVEATPEQLPMALDALADVLRA